MAANPDRFRSGWDEVQEQETYLLRQMTVQESVGHLLALYRAFESQLQQTEHLFRAERMAHRAELQHRLASLETSDGRSD